MRPGGHTRSSRSARNVGTCNGARVVFGRFGRNRTTAKGKIVTYGVCQKRASQSASGPRPIIAAKRNAPARLRARDLFEDRRRRTGGSLFLYSFARRRFVPSVLSSVDETTDGKRKNYFTAAAAPTSEGRRACVIYAAHRTHKTGAKTRQTSAKADGLGTGRWEKRAAPLRTCPSGASRRGVRGPFFGKKRNNNGDG